VQCALRAPAEGEGGDGKRAARERRRRRSKVEIFEGNLAQLREDEMEGLSSEDEESD
jgi:hypothetical protein